MPESTSTPSARAEPIGAACPPAPTAFTQRVQTERSPSGWSETVVSTLNRYGQTENETTIRSRDGWPFVDISITEYVGIKRRAKLTSVRLEEEAARELFAVCRALFGEGAAR